MTEREALLAYADQVADAAMRFSIECVRARYDLQAMLDGDEPAGPVFVDRRQAIQEHQQSATKRATEGRKRAAQATRQRSS